ncbi:MAG: metallophosphoesterase, partial [Bacteroidota bacterium]
QWNEFDAMIDRLKMPFFYLPGNHDITNAVMDSLWTARLGPKYYHFVYKDVLFLCLNSEDQYRGAGRGTISDAQYTWIEETLAANRDVRWTFLFLHQPLWDQENPERWPDVEALLRNREHSVFAGHVHRYQKFRRNNGRYYTLATTGGGSRLRGPRLGEFDHVTWVTMTDDGPVLANIALDGIHSDSVTTREDYEFFTDIYQSTPVRFSPILAGSSPAATERVEMQFHNPADIPMKVRLKPGFSFAYLSELPIDTLTVPPNNVVDYAWDIRRRGGRAAADANVPLHLELSFDYAGNALRLPLDYRVAPQPKRPLTEKAGVKIDGKLDDWGTENFPYSFGPAGADGHV